MAVRTASQVVSESLQKEVSQRRLFREKSSGVIPRPLKRSLPVVPSGAAASFKKFEKNVVDIKRAVDTQTYLQREKDDTKAYECWMASYAQFGNDIRLERKARVIREGKPDKKATVNKVYACWLEPGDSWGDPDYSRHKRGGYPTRDKYESRSGLSVSKRRGLNLVMKDPGLDMLRTVWDRGMSKFQHLHPEGMEAFHRPPTYVELLAHTWPRGGLFGEQDKASEAMLSIAEASSASAKVRVATAANDEGAPRGRYATVDKQHESDHSQTEALSVSVTNALTGEALKYDPVEYHRKQQKQYLWYLENMPKDVSQHSPLSKGGFVGPIKPETYVPNAKSGFLAWSKKVKDVVGKIIRREESPFTPECYECWNLKREEQRVTEKGYVQFLLWWLDDDDRRYQATLAGFINPPRLDQVGVQSHEALLKHWEDKDSRGESTPDMKERVRLVRAAKAHSKRRKEKLQSMLDGPELKPLVPVGEPYGDYSREVKEYSVRFNMNPERVIALLKGIDEADTGIAMPDSEYESLLDVAPKEEEISQLAEALVEDYISELGVRYYSVGGILVPERVAKKATVLVLKQPDERESKPVLDVSRIEEALYTDVQPSEAPKKEVQLSYSSLSLWGRFKSDWKDAFG